MRRSEWIQINAFFILQSGPLHTNQLIEELRNQDNKNRKINKHVVFQALRISAFEKEKIKQRNFFGESSKGSRWKISANQYGQFH